MRHYLKNLLITAISLYAVVQFIPTIHFGLDPKNILIIIAGLFIADEITHPIFSLVLIPQNILTHTALSIILNFAVLFGLTLFLPGFYISAYKFPGAYFQGFNLSPMVFTSIITILLIAAAMSFIDKILHWIFH